jgi:hypothetical protein
MGSAHAAVTEFVLYGQPDLKGEPHVVKGEVNQIAPDVSATAASLAVRGGYWQVCSASHFKGTCRILAPGEYRRLGEDLHQQVIAVRFLGDNPGLSAHESVFYREARKSRDWLTGQQKIPGAIDLYTRPDFGGKPVRVADDVTDLPARQFEGRAASLVVHEGTWQVCSERGFEGVCRTFRPGEYSQLGMFDGRVYSVRRLR